MRNTALLMIYFTAHSASSYPTQYNPRNIEPRDLLGILDGQTSTTSSIPTTPTTTAIAQVQVYSSASSYSASSNGSSIVHKANFNMEQSTAVTSNHPAKITSPKATATSVVHLSPALQAMIPTSIKETTLTDVVYSTHPITIATFVSEPSRTTSSPAITTASKYIAQAPGDTPPAELTEWKVIGIAVISVTLIAIIILSVTFFDSWWGLLRAVLLGKKKNGGKETLLPDPEQRSWEFKLANEDGHRYPTMESLESIAKEKHRQADRRVICHGQAPTDRKSEL